MSSSLNLPDYIDYFRQLAVKHKDLRHDITSEENDSREKAFARWSVEEVLMGLRSKMKNTFLMLELFEEVDESEIVYDIKGKFSGAFTVLSKGSDTNIRKQLEAFVLAHQITTDLRKKIWQDHYGIDKDRCQTPFQYFDFNGQTATPVGPLLDGDKFGYRVEFTFQFRQTENLTTPPEAGTFID